MKDQIYLIEQCKAKNQGTNLASELAELLGVNIDAAYRRMRGTTALTLGEIKKICLHFSISFDSVINYQSSLVPFQFNAMFQEKFSILDYLKGIASQMGALAKDPNSRFVLTAMDLPYFRQFGFKNLSRFKLFFWQKSVLNLPAFVHKKFDGEEGETDEYDLLAREIYENYHKVASTEIWTSESIDSAIKQIEYYAESGMFVSKESALAVCNDISELLKKIELEAQQGKKILNTKDGTSIAGFEMYQGDIYLSNNLIQAYTNDKTYTYVSFNSFNSLMSFAPNFSIECHNWIEQIRSKSVLLSEVSERLRYQYFLGLRFKLDALKETLEGYRG